MLHIYTVCNSAGAQDTFEYKMPFDCDLVGGTTTNANCFFTRDPKLTWIEVSSPAARIVEQQSFAFFLVGQYFSGKIPLRKGESIYLMTPAKTRVIVYLDDRQPTAV
jgi:hypothetical protein